MGKLIASMAMSLDGYIAKKNGDASWLNNAMSPDEDYGFADFMSKIGAYIIGANTYREITKSGALGGDDKVPTYVVSHQKNLKTGKNTYLYSGDLTELVKKIKTETEKDIWLFGGGDLTTQSINLNLVDELAIAIVPVLIGGDVPFFGNVVEQKNLILLESKTYEKSGMVTLTYGFKKAKRNRKDKK
ncbi:MAG TPA: dihydrofolate reductase family protein [Anaerolineales bacterium]|nr:dihydrofolate reductase family protein [Anaerolineales bacterium]